MCHETFHLEHTVNTNSALQKVVVVVVVVVQHKRHRVTEVLGQQSLKVRASQTIRLSTHARIHEDP